MVRRSSSFNTARINHIYQDPHEEDLRLRLFYGDLSDGSSVHTMLERVKPHEVYNLGAQSHVKVSFEIPEYTGTSRAWGRCDSSKGFGSWGSIAASIRHHRLSYMARSWKRRKRKRHRSIRAAHMPPRRHTRSIITRNYRESYGMFAVNGILFNHESPVAEKLSSREKSLGPWPRSSAGVRKRSIWEPRRQAGLGIRG